MTDDSREIIWRSVPDATLVVDERFNILDRNATARRLFDRGRGTRMRFSDLVAIEAERSIAILKKRLQTEDSCRLELAMVSWMGIPFTAELSVSHFNLNGVRGYQINVHDVMHRKRNEAQLRHVALHEALTDLPNRLSLLDTLAERIANGRGGTLIWAGVDRFKLINDSLGYRAGDEVIVTVGERLLDIVGDEQQLSHLGGDNFALILGPDEDAESVAKRASDAVAKPVDLQGRPIYLTCSYGIAASDSSYADPEEWLADAEIALYRAKQQGRGHIVTFDRSQRAQVASQLQLENELRIAIEQNQFELYFQPIVSLAERQVTALETLVRWRCPKRGIMMPGDFLPTMVRAGMLATLDRIVLRSAVEQIAVWNKKMGVERVPRIHINVSSEKFVGESLIGDLDALLSTHGVLPQQIELEITEGTLFEYPDRVASLLEELKTLGVRVSLDDFGTGFSSLSYLQQYPVDSLKIDRSFIDVATRSTAILKALVMLGDALGVDLIAEGIETEEAMELARELGVEFGQGFYIARPLPAAQAEQWLEPANVLGGFVSRSA